MVVNTILYIYIYLKLEMMYSLLHLAKDFMVLYLYVKLSFNDNVLLLLVINTLDSIIYMVKFTFCVGTSIDSTLLKYFLRSKSKYSNTKTSFFLW